MLIKTNICRSLMGTAAGRIVERKTMLGHVANAARKCAAGDVKGAYSSLRFALAYACRLQDREAMSRTMTAQNRLRGYARRHSIAL